MEENKVRKINLSTFLLMITIITIIIMGYYIYQISIQKLKTDEQIHNLNAEIHDLNTEINNFKNLVESYQKIDTINNTINNKNNSITDNTSTFNKTELKSAIQKYFDIRQILSSDTLNVLVELGLKTTIQNPDDYDGFSYDKPYSNSYFLITDVSYSDFENAISKYMTLNLFNSQYPDYVMNKDGVLCIYSNGGTSGSSTVKEFSISNTNSGNYICDVTIIRHTDDDGNNHEEKFTVTVIEKDGKYIISNCQ